MMSWILVMNLIPKMHSIPPKVETMKKSTFPFQFPNWRSMFVVGNVIGWGTPFVKCTSMGALSSSNWSSILLALFWVIKFWKAPMSKRHNTSHLKTFPFKKIRWLRSPWARLVVEEITLENPHCLIWVWGNLWSNVPLHYNWNMFLWASC